ncbi:MAG: 6,7-dimethyl-8-ribityllumazine synthase 1 [Holosporales bacterium]
MSYAHHTPHVVIIESRFYPDIADELYRGAALQLEHHGIAHSRITVPGALELPAALRIVIEATKSGSMISTEWRKPDGYVILGALLRAEIGCADLVYQEVLRSLQDLACYYTLPVSYGLIIANTIEQSMSVASVQGGNKGGEAAQSCLSLMDLKRKLGLHSGAVLSP